MIWLVNLFNEIWINFKFRSLKLKDEIKRLHTSIIGVIFIYFKRRTETRMFNISFRKCFQFENFISGKQYYITEIWLKALKNLEKGEEKNCFSLIVQYLLKCESIRSKMGIDYFGMHYRNNKDNHILKIGLRYPWSKPNCVWKIALYFVLTFGLYVDDWFLWSFLRIFSIWIYS